MWYVGHCRRAYLERGQGREHLERICRLVILLHTSRHLGFTPSYRVIRSALLLSLTRRKADQRTNREETPSTDIAANVVSQPRIGIPTIGLLTRGIFVASSVLWQNDSRYICCLSSSETSDSSLLKFRTVGSLKRSMSPSAPSSWTGSTETVRRPSQSASWTRTSVSDGLAKNEDGQDSRRTIWVASAPQVITQVVLNPMVQMLSTSHPFVE